MVGIDGGGLWRAWANAMRGFAQSQQYHLNNPYWATFDPAVEPWLAQRQSTPSRFLRFLLLLYRWIVPWLGCLSTQNGLLGRDLDWQGSLKIPATGVPYPDPSSPPITSLS